MLFGVIFSWVVCLWVGFCCFRWLVVENVCRLSLKFSVGLSCCVFLVNSVVLIIFFLLWCVVMLELLWVEVNWLLSWFVEWRMVVLMI